MSFTIVSSYSPNFAPALDLFVPTWRANAGADDIVLHEINEGSWTANIKARNEKLIEELIARPGQRVLSLDIDCLVLRNLEDGFSPQHSISVSRWPDIQMGVAFFNQEYEFSVPWLQETLRMIRALPAVRKKEERNRQYDQPVWSAQVLPLKEKVFRLGDWEWNYHFKERHQYQRDWPILRDVTKIIHLKSHGHWPLGTIAFAKSVWPRELDMIVLTELATKGRQSPARSLYICDDCQDKRFGRANKTPRCAKCGSGNMTPMPEAKT